jgi:hypothetical protein
MGKAGSTPGVIRNANKILVGQTPRDHIGKIREYWRIILKGLSEKQGVPVWTGLGTLAGFRKQ